jgi:hypothetical protein
MNAEYANSMDGHLTILRELIHAHIMWQWGAHRIEHVPEYLLQERKLQFMSPVVYVLLLVQMSQPRTHSARYP